MASRVIDKDRGYKAFVRAMQNASKADPHVTVGVHGKDEARGGDEPTNVEVATFNEFGTTTAPARPFLRTAVDENRRKYATMFQRTLGLWVDGKTTLHDALAIVGTQAKADVQLKITKIRDPPNAPSTIERKGSSNPLIDTGQMRQAVDFVVHAKKGV